MKRFSWILALALAFISQGVMAKVVIGQPPPEFKTGEWIQGEPVTQFEPGQVYVVEFWATWCGPCVATIPHLNELAKKYKDQGVTFIGVDIWDEDSAVPAFVKRMGAKMTYRVALDDKSDDKEGFISDNWWKRHTEAHGIPNAFIINKHGVVAWGGHPATLKEDVIEQILADKFDVARFAVEYQKDQEINEKMSDGQQKIFSAMNEKRWSDAKAALDDLLKQFPNIAPSFNITRFRILIGETNYPGAWAWGETCLKENPKNDYQLNELGWEIVSLPNLEQRNLDLATRLAERAIELSGGKDSDSLDTLARAQFMSGKTADAIETEQKAVQFSPQKRRDDFQKVLALYQQGKLPELK
jgi:thiol-disulfide isomerase/thioredoxin